VGGWLVGWLSGAFNTRGWEKLAKIANFSYPRIYIYIYSPRLRGSPCNLVSAQGVSNASMMGLPDGRKSFKIGLVVLINPFSGAQNTWGGKNLRYSTKIAVYLGNGTR